MCVFVCCLTLVSWKKIKSTELFSKIKAELSEFPVYVLGKEVKTVVGGIEGGSEVYGKS